MTTQCEWPAGRGLRAPPAGDRRATGGAPKPRAAYRKRARPAGDGDRPPRGVLNITAAVWTVGFHWWRFGNKKPTQNVSEYMLVLALCLVAVSKGTTPTKLSRS